MQAARELAFAPRGQLQLAGFVQHDVPEIGLKSEGAQRVSEPGGLPSAELRRGSCAACFIGVGDPSGQVAWMAGLAGLAGIAGFVVRRVRKNS